VTGAPAGAGPEDGSQPAVSRVAFLGLGRMGAAMAERIARAGLPLTVWNRTPERARQLAANLAVVAQVEVAASPGACVAGADLVVSMLADGPALRSVLDGSGGALETIAPGTLWIDMGTSGPLAVREAAALLATAEVGFVDAPVSGSVDFARDGTLTVMAGGAAADVARAREVLDLLASRRLECGAPGSGATLKLAVNLLVHALNSALSEALVLAESAGVDRSTAFDLFTASAAAAPFVQYKRAEFEHPDDAPVTFSLALVEKDLALISQLEHALGTPSDVADVLRDQARRALAAGYADRDMSALAAYHRERASAPGSDA
jgi:3-hydroxyisobutyrate dehydrogenase-like beta-hydroxyacid dehydrogenase